MHVKKTEHCKNHFRDTGKRANSKVAVILIVEDGKIGVKVTPITHKVTNKVQARLQGLQEFTQIQNISKPVTEPKDCYCRQQSKSQISPRNQNSRQRSMHSSAL
jgi:hypothetical protein